MDKIKSLFGEYWYVAVGVIVLLLLFAPAICNGVTHYTGIRGCSTGSDENDTPGENKMFFNLISF